MAGTRFKLIGPYPASNDAMLAMERGEVDGAFTSYNTLKVSRQDWLHRNKINILVQYGEHAAELPDVPFAVELAGSAEDRDLMRFYVSSEQIGRSFLAPPGVAAERVAVLRKAYEDTMLDPDFLAEIAKSRTEFSPLSGANLQKLVTGTANVKPEIVTRDPHDPRARPLSRPRRWTPAPRAMLC